MAAGFQQALRFVGMPLHRRVIAIQVVALKLTGGGLLGSQRGNVDGYVFNGCRSGAEHKGDKGWRSHWQFLLRVAHLDPGIGCFLFVPSIQESDRSYPSDA
jgi:hypothetical protein